MNLDRFDAVTLMVGNKRITGGTTFTVNEFTGVIGEFIKQKTSAPYQEWIKDGVDCLVLQPGKDGWVKGKVRISLEFMPEEEELGEEEVSTSVAVLEESPSIPPVDVVFSNSSSEIQ